MEIDITNAWFHFCIAFGGMLTGTFIMGRLGNRFYTMDPLKRKVSMLALEFPAKETEVANILKGVFLLDEEEKKASINSFRWQIILDFLLFMPCAYGSIFILCSTIAPTLKSTGENIFMILAYAQILCFALDAIENIYLWSNLKPNAKNASKFTFRLMQILEALKWGFALIGAIGGLSVICFYWLSGNYNSGSLIYILIFFLEIVVFLLLSKIKTKSA
ncbi:hypothetical protein F0919_13160 [Taibaiella lutea]|uniref:Uncharacterized protein n=1 Tax=Taibaiella lutea TaxID=2608001 RepID=A0A5M6CE93_9BACT|nr:hypothetical protein [Taibaiella lutea]KAA5533484.1 hypothetical protein F0919_13160 [Taibaiella lutea]